MPRRARAVLAPPVPSLRANDLRFLEAYLTNGGNGKRAYQVVHPGVKSNTAETEAWRVLRKPKVAEELARRLQVEGGVTRTYVERSLLKYQSWADAKQDYLAGASICMDAAKLAGLITDKREVTTVTDGESRAIRDLVQRALRQPASLSPSVNHEDGTAPHTPPQYPPASSVPTVSAPLDSSTVSPTVDEASVPKRPCGSPPTDDPPRPEER